MGVRQSFGRISIRTVRDVASDSWTPRFSVWFFHLLSLVRSLSVSPLFSIRRSRRKLNILIACEYESEYIISCCHNGQWPSSPRSRSRFTCQLYRTTQYTYDSIQRWTLDAPCTSYLFIDRNRLRTFSTIFHNIFKPLIFTKQSSVASCASVCVCVCVHAPLLWAQCCWCGLWCW